LLWLAALDDPPAEQSNRGEEYRHRGKADVHTEKYERDAEKCEY
jgi:hypothetical protein